jgi:DUF2917 family protein
MRMEHQSMRWVSLDFPSSRDEDDDLVNARVVMMNAQQSFATLLGSVDPEAVRALPAGHVVALGNGGGRVSILSGRVWLTSGSDPDDHFLGAGETFDVPNAGPTLVEAWSRGDSAVIAWRPRTFAERLHRRLVRSYESWWKFVSPGRRAGVGTVAGVIAVAVLGAVVGPVFEARSPAAPAALPHAAVLHNAERGVAREAARGAPADGADDTGYRPSGAARQADRRAPGAA